MARHTNSKPQRRQQQQSRPAAIVRHATLTYLGEQVHVSYYPDRIRAVGRRGAVKMRDDLNRLARAGDTAAFTARIGEIWSTCLASWDVTEEEGPDAPPVPLDDGATLFALDPTFDLFAAILAACHAAEGR